MKRKLKLILIALVSAQFLFAQNPPQQTGTLTGNFQFDGQLYLRDPEIDPTGEFYPDERFLGQGFMNLNYTHGDFRAGVRYENYQNVLLGYPERFRGEGITYRYAQYVKDGLDITVGNYYEQFGSGLIFRSFEERMLGLDNVMDGVRLRYEPIKGVYLKGVIGRQRKYFALGNGIVRGIDAEITLNHLMDFMAESKTNINFGGSFVSKFERDNDPRYNLPQNVGSAAIRGNITRGNFNINGEYVYKANDPSADNKFIFRPGQGFIVNATYATRGFGVMGSVKRIDNMSFRSERNAQETEVFVNFLPPTTKFHTYALPALYPYDTQLNGEIGFQGELNYNFARGSRLGGRYGTLITVNYSSAYSIYKELYDPENNPNIDTIREGYRSNWLRVGQIKYFQDINIELKKKINKNLKMTATYYNIEYSYNVLFDGVRDEPILQGTTDAGMVYINAFVLETEYRLDNKRFLRSEIQGLFTKQDRGDMAMLLVEYSVSPHWSIGVQNIYNYGNPNPEERSHYPLASMTYRFSTHRIQLNYGRQMRGIFCVGGICRVVPPSNGFSISVSSNF